MALSLKERILVSLFAVFAAAGFLFWIGAIYISSTKEVAKIGGEYIEGIVGQPSYINPIISQTSDVDADIVALVYAGLFEHDVDGRLAPRLASEYSVSEDGKEYTVKLRENVKWHDGTDITAADIVFTVQTIKNPAYKSPLRKNWVGAEVSSPDSKTVVFTLEKPYIRFIENLSVGILPKHIWSGISPEKFFLAENNLLPIGSGPFQYGDMKKDAEGNILWYELKANESYVLGRPYLDSIRFRFYVDEESLLLALNRGEVLGMSNVSPENLDRLKQKKSLVVRELNHPRSFAVFPNTSKNAALAYDEIRQALSLATDRQALIDEVLSGKGKAASSPFLSFMAGFDAEFSSPRFDLSEAEKVLDEKGWEKGDDGIRSKNGVRAEFELTVPDWTEFAKTAELLAKQWEVLGVRANIAVVDLATAQQEKIRPREYDALLFGEAPLIEPDMYSFWHSKEREDPGLNLSSFNEEAADSALLSAREAKDMEAWTAAYRSFQEVFARETPAIFLYSPSFLFVSTDRLKGVGVNSIDIAADRFSLAHEWYMKTKRVRK